MLSATLVAWMTAASLPLPAAHGWTSPAAGGDDPARAEERLRLERGEVAVGTTSSGGLKAVQAAILIDAPVQRVWDVMVDCGRAAEFVPGMRECRILERQGDRELIRHRVKISSLLPEITYTFRAEQRKYDRIDFVRTGGDLKALKGSWTLEMMNGGRQTLVRYSVYIDPGFLVPQWAMRQALRHDLPQLLLALRRRVASEPG